MRTSEKDKQKMYYALFLGEEPIYEIGPDGRKIVERETADGKVYYRETGTTRAVYSTPVEFWASISSNLNAIHCREYGVDASSIYSEIHCSKGYLPLKYGAKIWRESDIVWFDEEHGIPDADSSDYTVRGILNEFLNFDWFLLMRNN